MQIKVVASPEDDRGLISELNQPDCRDTNSAPSVWLAPAMIIGVGAIRLAYLIWACPYELVGDEAYYWVQSRHLELCYNEKGPALPWLIALCCRAFGDHEWSVRLSMVISSALAAWLAGRIAMTLAGRELARIWAVAFFLLLPAFMANAQICTQDGPLILIWLLLTAIGLRLFRRWRAGEETWAEWLSFWLVMGIGILFKQSIPLFLLGMGTYALLERRKLAWRLELLAQQAAGLGLMVVVISPMIVWNQRHGWPMLSHTLGHLAGMGDQAGEKQSGNAAVWFLNTAGGIAGAFGPGAVALMAWVSWRVIRTKRRDSQANAGRLWIVCAAWPAVLFFIGMSLFKPVVPSWPLPSFAPLAVLVGEMAAAELPHRARLLARWKSSPTRATTRGPDTGFHKLWVTTIAYGLIGAVVISFPNLFAHLPLVGARWQKSVLRRFTGHRSEAAALEQFLARGKQRGEDLPVLVARYYMRACLASFYLPDHPTVCTADYYLGKRQTNFDHWPDTRLDNPALKGRTFLFLGQSDIEWARLFDFDRIEPVQDGAYFIGSNYHGPRLDNPRLARTRGARP